ncbi:MAG: hypothetical protein ACPG8W_09100 [Candidatus Promineifilaceae bacterium]
MSWYTSLSTPPAGYVETQALIAALDRCFIVGFANLSQADWDALAAVERVLVGSPLATAFADCCTALRSNTFVAEQFATLAATRISLQGALHDALLAQLRGALNRPLPSSAPVLLPNQTTAPIEASIRHWLMEVALLGFARLDAEAVTPFLKTLETVQSDPARIALASLLTGFMNELMRFVPVSDSADVPSYRWVDLWSQGMLLSFGSAEIDPAPVSGTLELYGLDLRQTAHVVSFVLHGVLQTDGDPQQVRITQSAYKVDSIRGKELWLLFPHAKTLLTAFSATKQLAIDTMPLLPTGDLIWNDEQATVGKKFKQLVQAEQFFAPDATSPALCWTLPANRHPIQLAEPIFLEKSADIVWADQRVASEHELDPATFEKADAAFGLLRFDAGEWHFQPLTVGRKGTKFIGQAAGKLASKPPKRSSVSLLQERASRLLRAS